VYCVVFGTGIYYILKLLRQGPAGFDTAPAPAAPKDLAPDTVQSAEKVNQSGRRPLAAAD
jgi:cytochrome d ubiquinol oxidase subunit I